MKTKSFDAVAKAILDNHKSGAHLLIGPALIYGDKPAFIAIVGDTAGEPLIVAIDLEAKDLKQARAWRESIFGRLSMQCIDARMSVVIHDCGDDQQLINWACACYPGRKLEELRAKILGGGNA